MQEHTLEYRIYAEQFATAPDVRQYQHRMSAWNATWSDSTYARLFPNQWSLQLPRFWVCVSTYLLRWESQQGGLSRVLSGFTCQSSNWALAEKLITPGATHGWCFSGFPQGCAARPLALWEHKSCWLSACHFPQHSRGLEKVLSWWVMATAAIAQANS